jgi:hypothetical protein
MIHIAQLLCPARHAIMGVPFDGDQLTLEEVLKMAHVVMHNMGVQDHCGICGSTDLSWEEGVTKWKTMEEAAPFLSEVAAQQALTRAVLDNSGQSYDQQRKN